MPAVAGAQATWVFILTEPPLLTHRPTSHRGTGAGRTVPVEQVKVIPDLYGLEPADG